MSNLYHESIQQVIDSLGRLNKAKYLIGVDGPGGSGKSTLAQELSAVLPNTVIVHIDDFYKPKYLRDTVGRTAIGAFFDWQRLEQQVLIPFTGNRDILFQRYDWPGDTLQEWQSITNTAGVIVEGVYTIRKELAGYYDVKIWIDCPADICLARGIARDGIGMKEYWQNVWMKQEQEYCQQHQPHLSADIKISGNKA